MRADLVSVDRHVLNCRFSDIHCVQSMRVKTHVQPRKDRCEGKQVYLASHSAVKVWRYAPIDGLVYSMVAPCDFSRSRIPVDLHLSLE